MDANKNLSQLEALTSIDQSGGGKDISLEAGQSFCIERDGATLVTAVHRAPFALIRIEPPVAGQGPLRERFAARLWRFWTALYVPESHPTSASL
jgi:hypothetical protein